MAGQNVSDLKLVIIELDGCIFPLNHYRYNFYKNLCKKQKVAMDRQTFYNALGNMFTMYDSLPLSSTTNSSSFNQTVEKDLYDYLEVKGIKPNDGVMELLEYLKQKDIKIAVVSTHKTKDAIRYLEKGKLYNRIDYVIGTDTKLQPFPSTDIIDFLIEKYGVNKSQTLLITSIGQLLDSGHAAGINLIYVEDLVKAGDKEHTISYEVSKSMYETLNDIIFGRYEDFSMYQSILGMDDNMSPEELHSVRGHLADVYSGDNDLMDIVNKTYEWRLSELNVDPVALDDEISKTQQLKIIKQEELEKEAQRLEEEKRQQEEAPEELPAEEEEELPLDDTEESTSELSLEDELAGLEDMLSAIERGAQENEEPAEELVEDEEDDLEAELKALEDSLPSLDEEEEEPAEEDEEVVVEEATKEFKPVDKPKEFFFPDDDETSLSLDKQATGELDSVIDKIFSEEEKEIEEEKETDKEEPKKKKVTLEKVGSALMNILYTFSLSLVILVVGLLIYTSLQASFEHGVLSFVKDIYLVYSNIANAFMSAILTVLHAIIPPIPSYANWMKNNGLISSAAAGVANVYFFNTFIIAIVEVVVYFINKKKDKE